MSFPQTHCDFPSAEARDVGGQSLFYCEDKNQTRVKFTIPCQRSRSRLPPGMPSLGHEVEDAISSQWQHC